MHKKQTLYKESVADGDTFCCSNLERKCEEMKCVIISGGHIEDAFAIEWLKENTYDLLIAADSGMNFLYRNRIVPDVVAGDFDSVSRESLAAFAEMKNVEMLRLNPIKDDTDTEFVIREAIRRGAKEITLLGATGTRLDHVFGNMHLLGIGLTHDVKICLVDKYNRIRMIQGEMVLEKENQFGLYVSFLPIDGSVTGVTLEGFKYPLENATIRSFSSLGISNEIVEDVATVKVEKGVLLMIESRDE